jgi:hypothetical protein
MTYHSPFTTTIHVHTGIMNRLDRALVPLCGGAQVRFLNESLFTFHHLSALVDKENPLHLH